MAEEQGTEEQGTEEQQGTETGTETEELGEAGKKALQDERQARRTAEREAKAAKAELDKLRNASQSEQEKALAAAKAEGRAEALSVANERLKRAEVRSLAAGKLADPDDAVRLLELDDFEIDDDGNVDRKKVTSAIDALINDKPYLAGKPSPNGAGDGGPRGGSADGADMNALLRQAAGR